MAKAAFGVVLIVGVLASTLGGQQAPPAAIQPATAPPPRGVIFGRVVDADTGRPVAGALVTCSPDRAASEAARAAGIDLCGVRRVSTNAEGQYVLRNLPHGAYFLRASADGYLESVRTSRPVELKEPARAVAAELKLSRSAVITGMITDDNGTPAINVEVAALQRPVAGRPLQIAGWGSDQTDDRGAFRIGGLSPGEYVVVIPSSVVSVPASITDQYRAAIVAGDQDALRQFTGLAVQPHVKARRIGNQDVLRLDGDFVAANDQIFTYSTQFFPSSATISDATPIVLRSGEVRTGIDLQRKLTKTLRVSGVVAGPDQKVANIHVLLVPLGGRDGLSDEAFPASTTLTDGGGRFVLLGVPPGQYVVKVVVPPAPTEPSRVVTTFVGPDGSRATMSSVREGPATAVLPTLWAQTTVSVSDTDVADLSLTLREGFSASGRLVFEGTASPPAPDRLVTMRVGLMLLDSQPPFTSTAPIPSQRITSAGEFRTSQYVPGRYNISLPVPTPPWTLKSITAGGRDLIDEPVDLTVGDASGLVITYTDRPSELAGSVQDGSRRAAEAWLLVCPANFEAWITGGMSPRRFRVIPTDAAGGYRITSLPPGNYLVFALPLDSSLNLQDPDTRRRIMAGAVRVSLAEGERKTQNVVILRGR